jgi:hypothetical protein
MNMCEVMYARMNITITGARTLFTSTSSASIGLIRSHPARVVAKEIPHLIMNINIAAIPSTMANLTEFLSTSKKEWMADEQKLSLVQAI